MKRIALVVKNFFVGEITPVNHAEKLLSGLGALIGIATAYAISTSFIAATDVPLIVASMGASAVLLFAVPHSPLSQPWPLLGSHLISCLVGITCARFIPNAIAAAAVAVAAAIVVMYYLRCLHPPGGATALSAVIGGPSVHALGYQFLVTPVLVNVLCMLAVAVLFNYFFAWRRYPIALTKRAEAVDEKTTPEARDIGIDTNDITFALEHMDSYVDVSEQDLTRIYALALQHAQSSGMPAEHILIDRYYSNGRYGTEWSVRHVVDTYGAADPEKDKVVYRVVAGNGRRGSGTMTRAEFAHWAKYQVVRNENSWQRVTHV